ncbi:MAG: Homospermidine synthase (EC [uncultured Paraburkholderia sp.]|uniref:saccharopine dehydrogenase NADP-binding domain-containing protein n=1 Tax=uncultured Paraburkholderia sp. TaxID=1822466 RepID=UPI002596BF64|nr:saccharopine dehydrogenase NADP-binding domain-containing protein [uncultured Paraburkholderia sp.]CAH2901585.1 MAG: Homospermidine synthase (EC [uncultured Paraburkholderia sp.]CAH2934712.1 MAG: Homospermidine synthase (EC [uncultured Paraburkholderia sp.]
MNHPVNVVIVGFGNLGQALLPLLRAAFPACAVTAVEQHSDEERAAIANAWGVRLIVRRVEASNYVDVLGPLLRDGGFLLNLATAVETTALIQLAQQHGAFYLDTCIEPWTYSLGNADSTTNHALREQMLALAGRRHETRTALVAHGANPGFVSVLVKCALVAMVERFDVHAWQQRVPVDRDEWAKLAADLDVRVIQISERDTQRTETSEIGRAFLNTWSVDGFIAECLQDAEVGWGTHETLLPPGARRYRDVDGDKRHAPAIRLATNGIDTKVRTWTPHHGAFDAHVLTHNESISIADYLTLKDANDKVRYRPTVYYAYRPIDAALAWLPSLPGGLTSSDHGLDDRNRAHVLKDELVTGIDELGVLVMSGRGESLWLGSALSVERARSLAPLNNATSLQVVSSIVGGMQWMIDHPWAGIVESDALDHAVTFERVRAFWEPIERVWTRWRPGGTELLFGDFISGARHTDADVARTATFNFYSSLA